MAGIELAGGERGRARRAIVALLALAVAIPFLFGSARLAHAASTFAVGTTEDAQDANPGDGNCTSTLPSGLCTLRAAVEESEALGSGTIHVPEGDYALTLAPVSGDTTAASLGDLEISHTVTVIGAGAGKTFLDGNSTDRIFDIHASGSLTVEKVTLWRGVGTTDNVTGHQHGGAIHNHGHLTLLDSTVRGNAVPQFWGGGGVTNAGGATATMKNDTFSGNFSPTRGGGIENLGTLDASNLTIQSQTSPTGTGGGIFSTGTATLRNTVLFAGNSNCAGTVTSAGHNLSDDASCLFVAPGDMNSTNPLIGPFVDDVSTLQPNSPAIDAGDNSSCTANDERGAARPQDGNGDAASVCDIGAYEHVLRDFGRDGVSDVGIGVPGETIGSNVSAGAANVLYGSLTDGLAATPFNQLLTQNSRSVFGSSQSFDRFGSVLATGDFNGDGFADLAVGVPGERSPSGTGAGAVDVFYGSFTLLPGPTNQVWTQNSPGVADVAEAGDGFGSALAVGDFNRDGFADLAIGVPGEDTGLKDVGAVNVLYGGPAGLSATGSEFWDQAALSRPAKTGDAFGSSLAAGNFGGSAEADLAIGVPGKDVGTATDAGAVDVVYSGGSSGLSSAGNEAWDQGSPGILANPEPKERFGSALAAAEFGRGSESDLAVGVPGERIGFVAAGAVNVIYGSPTGLTAVANQLWRQGGGNLDFAENGDAFGAAVAGGDFNADGVADLSVGAPGEDVGAVSNAGAVSVFYGSAAGLEGAGNQFWTQNSPGVGDAAESGDAFGTALTAGDFGIGAQMELAIGVPGEDLSGVFNAGAANVLYGSPSGLTSTNNQFWTQNSPGVADVAESGDNFGFGLGWFSET